MKYLFTVFDCKTVSWDKFSTGVCNFALFVCTPKYSDIDECQKNPCKNDGQCTNNAGSFKGTCTQGWTGALCDEGTYIFVSIFI